MTKHSQRSIDDLIPKTELCRRVSRAESFIDALKLPSYPVGKRLYFKEIDYWHAIESIEPESKWESSKPKGRHITNTRSQSRVLGIEEARALISAQMLKNGSPPNAGRKF